MGRIQKLNDKSNFHEVCTWVNSGQGHFLQSFNNNNVYEQKHYYNNQVNIILRTSAHISSSLLRWL